MPLSNRSQEADEHGTKIIMGDFKYRPRNQVDRARMLQQQGIHPEPHRFQPDPGIPHMCCVEGCYATLANRAPWHIEKFFDGV